MSKRFPVTIEYAGRAVSGTYSVRAGLISVSTDCDRKSTHVGAVPPAALARIMLREMAQEGKA
jgi:hypothetical protein